MSSIDEKVSVDTVDGDNIKHLEECDGCPECDILLEFYSGCDSCERFGHMSTFYADGKGKLYCETCKDKLE